MNLLTLLSACLITGCAHTGSFQYDMELREAVYQDCIKKINNPTSEQKVACDDEGREASISDVEIVE